MKLYMMKASIREKETTTIYRFLSGLNLKIRGKVELLSYRDLIQVCIKVVQQILRKWSSCKESCYSSSYPKKEYKKERDESFSKDKSKETPKSQGKDVSTPTNPHTMF